MLYYSKCMNNIKTSFGAFDVIPEAAPVGKEFKMLF